MTGSDRGRLQEIEMKLFVNSAKNDIVNKLGPWIGTRKQNKEADLKIAEIIRRAIKNYEEEKNEYERCYFKF